MTGTGCTGSERVWSRGLKLAGTVLDLKADDAICQVGIGRWRWTAARAPEACPTGSLPTGLLLLGLNTNSITALIDRLETSGIAQRQPHPSDRRRSIVAMTTHGAAVIAGTGGRFARAFDHVAPDTLPEAAAMLTSIAADLRNTADDLTPGGGVGGPSPGGR